MTRDVELVGAVIRAAAVILAELFAPAPRSSARDRGGWPGAPVIDTAGRAVDEPLALPAGDDVVEE